MLSFMHITYHRTTLPDLLEPASSIDIACRLAGDLSKAYAADDTAGHRHRHGHDSDGRSEDSIHLSKEIAYWNAIRRTLMRK